MPDGFGYVFGQIVVLLLLALAAGVLIGRLLVPRRSPGADTSDTAGAAPQESAPGLFGAAHGPGDAVAATPDGPEAAAAAAYTQTRIAQAEARRAELEARLAEAQAQLARATTGLASLQNQATHARTELEQTRGRLAEAEATLTQTRHQLTEADAEVVRLRLQARELIDQKETEMGRLESGAIAALESTIATHQEQVTQLEQRLREAEHAAQEREHDLAAERRRTEHLQAALAERDQHLAAVTAPPPARPAVAPRPESGVGHATDAR